MVAWLGPAISAGATLLSGFLGQKQQADNVALQREFAQNAIQWRVADAKKAGIHPLYAMGAPTISPAIQTGGGMASAVASMGQDISRAVSAGMPKDVNPVAAQLASLQIERAGLENDVLRSQLARLNQSPSVGGPAASPMLIPGQGDTAGASPSFKEKPLERTPSAAGTPHQTAAALPSVTWERTETGWVPQPTPELKQLMEDSPMEWVWFFRNQVLPSVTGMRGTPPFPRPAEADWKWIWHPIGEWRQVPLAPAGPRFFEKKLR